MSEIRYCRKCQEETRHDVLTIDRVTGNQEGGFSRLLTAVLTMGLNEIDICKCYVCQKCGKRTIP